MKTSIQYFKLQAKNFFRDFKTQELGEDGLYCYKPRFFNDLNEIIVSFDINEDDFSLMKAQQIIAYLSGVQNWTELIHAEQTKLEIARILLENRTNPESLFPTVDEWKYYIDTVEQMNGPISEEEKLELLQYFLGIKDTNEDGRIKE